MTLDVSAMTGPKWSQRFIIAVAPVVEDSSFLFYGHGFASLMELPETPDNSAPIVAQLPARYVPVVSRVLYRLCALERGYPNAGHGRA